MRVSRDESGINISRTTEPAAPFSARVSRQIYPKPFRLIEQLRDIVDTVAPLGALTACQDSPPLASAMPCYVGISQTDRPLRLIPGTEVFTGSERSMP